MCVHHGAPGGRCRKPRPQQLSVLLIKAFCAAHTEAVVQGGQWGGELSKHVTGFCWTVLLDGSGGPAGQQLLRTLQPAAVVATVLLSVVVVLLPWQQNRRG